MRSKGFDVYVLGGRIYSFHLPLHHLNIARVDVDVQVRFIVPY